MGWLARLDETKDADLAAFRRPARVPYVWIPLGVLGLGVTMVLPVLLSPWIGAAAMLGWPLEMLLWTVWFSTSPSGRGALWEFGKGRSPRQSVLGLAVVNALLALALAALWIYQRVR